MKTALVYPPACDPTAPYVSLPSLAGFLRQRGHEVLLVDANLEAFCGLFEKDALLGMGERVERHLAALGKKSSLFHGDKLAWAALWRARGEALLAPDRIGDALSVLRDKSGRRFFSPKDYGKAIAVVESALRLVSAAHFPLSMDFSAYRTPFSLSSAEEIERDSRPDRNPFHGYFAGELSDLLVRERVGLVGVSVAFPGQIQPAYSLAFALKKRLPRVFLVAGGPALTQLFARLGPEERERALGPFSAVVLYEGEETLDGLIRDVEQGRRPSGVLEGRGRVNLAALGPPDFDGLSLGRYFSPAAVLPYDATRGCPWGKCAFCQYGLADKGTAPFQERPAENVAAHLRGLAGKHGCRVFFLSQDTMRVAHALALARGLEGSGLRFSSDMRPGRELSASACRDLARGGALSFSLGVESGSERVLRLMRKGLRVEEARAAIQNLATAGVAPQVMTFTGFPTETFSEARKTLALIEELRDSVALFICGQFMLVHGADAAVHPERYGIAETWTVAGDEFKTGLFFRERNPARQSPQRLERMVAKLSRAYFLNKYPWAGSLSTAHTLLWLDAKGPDAFRKAAQKRPFPGKEWSVTKTGQARFDVLEAERGCEDAEARIWEELVYERRSIRKEDYQALADGTTPLAPRPAAWAYGPGGRVFRFSEPDRTERAEVLRATCRGRRGGRLVLRHLRGGGRRR